MKTLPITDHHRNIIEPEWLAEIEGACGVESLDHVTRLLEELGHCPC